jgi:hypothetical protein
MDCSIREGVTMSEHWVGVTVSGDKIIVVDAQVDTTGPIVVISDLTWKLQAGARSAAYSVMHRQLGDHLGHGSVKRVVIKASAVSRAGGSQAHLNAAELRGVVMAASASVTEVVVVAKAQISRTFGARNVDEYLADDGFWTTEVAGVSLRGGSREAALLLLAAR